MSNNTPHKFPLRKIYAIGHIVLVAICLALCLLLFKHWALAIPAYIIGNIMWPILLKFISQIGNYHEVERYSTEDGKVTPVFGNFVYRYGLLSSLRDTIVVFVVGYILILFALSLLPPIMASILGLAGVFCVFFNFLIYPLIVDVIQLVSDEDPAEMLAAKKKAYTRTLIISTLIFSIAATIFLPLIARSTLNANKIVASYYEAGDNVNLLASVDLNNAYKDIDDMQLECNLLYEGDVAIAENYVFPVCQISMSFHPLKLKWEVKKLSVLGESKITGPVRFEGETPEGTHQVEDTLWMTVCFDSAESGTLTLKDKTTGDELLNTPFDVGEYDTFWGGYEMTLAEPIRGEFFGYATFYFCSNNDDPGHAEMINDLRMTFPLSLQ